jgi:signal transduction histidine kinase
MPLKLSASAYKTLLRDMLVVIGFNVVLAAVISIYGHQPYGESLAYSLAIGTSIWAIIDISRFMLHPKGHVQGWRLALLVLVGTVLGYAAGNSLVDVLSGRQPFHAWQAAPKAVSGFFVMSLAAGAALVYFFMSREQLASARLAHSEAQHQAAEAERLAAQAEKQAAQAERQAAQARGQASEAQLSLLQSQLEPHMLFNTLANLRALIQTDPARATAMLDRLGDYLRATLAASRAPTHSLAAEFERLRDYLELMRVRMGERLTYELHLPHTLREVPVPPLLLQPLVENAIKHGLEPKVAGGWLRVQAHSQSERLVLQVEDNGVGLPDDTSRPGSGFGLAQVRERLHTRYGDNATFSIAGYADSTRAIVEFPL